MSKKESPFERKSKPYFTDGVYLDDECNIVYVEETVSEGGKKEIRKTIIPYSKDKDKFFREFDEQLRREALDNRYEEEIKDTRMLAKINAERKAKGEEEVDDLFEFIGDVRFEPLTMMCDEKEEEEPNPVYGIVKEIISSLPPSQQYLYEQLFVYGKTLDEVAQDEALVSGKKVSRQAIYNRKTKLLNTVKKRLLEEGVDKFGRG